MIEPLPRRLFAAGATALAAAVVIGAFGAHGLRATIAPERLATWHTGVEYHFYHALGLLAMGAIALGLPHSRALAWAGRCLVAGIVLFSGALYVLALTDVRAWGAVAPVGGTAFIAGWVLVLIALRPSATKPSG